jgi:hypothetical protein
LHRVAGLLAQRESHRLPRLLLHYRGTRYDVFAMRDIGYPQRDEVAAAQFAVCRRVEKGEIVDPAGDR